MNLFQTPDLAIDLGTAHIRVAGGRREAFRSPSVSRAARSLAGGVIVNVQAAAEILRPMIRRRHRMGKGRLRVLACAPTDVSALERNLVRSCILEAGASSVMVVPEPLAAAVGAGIDIGCRYAKFLVDFGDGVTDCALIREGQIVDSIAERAGCGDLRRIIQTFMEAGTGLPVTGEEADRILRSVGLAAEGAETRLEAGGQGRESPGMRIRLEALRAELQPVIDRMLAPIRTLLRRTTAGMGAEVIEDGIFLTGGGALLPGMRETVMAETGIDTRIVSNPLGAVICGARRMLPAAASLNLWKVWGSHQRS
ncbi:MAG: rod shape-determining protein [Verrucomicrobiota bacterium]